MIKNSKYDKKFLTQSEFAKIGLIDKGRLQKRRGAAPQGIKFLWFNYMVVDRFMSNFEVFSV